MTHAYSGLMDSLSEIVMGSAFLALIHALIPNHWLPLVAISRSEKWSTRYTLIITALVGLSHVVGTVIVGLLVGSIGVQMAEVLASSGERIASLILVLCGGFFVWRGLRHAHACKHHRLRLVGGGPEEHTAWTRIGLVFSLSFAMFLSPCVEILAFFLSASLFGWSAILTVSLTFLLITVPLMVALVWATLRGIGHFNWHALDHHGRTLTGMLLICLGCAITFFHD